MITAIGLIAVSVGILANTLHLRMLSSRIERGLEHAHRRIDLIEDNQRRKT